MNKTNWTKNPQTQSKADFNSVAYRYHHFETDQLVGVEVPVSLEEQLEASGAQKLLDRLKTVPPLVKEHPEWIVFHKNEWNKITGGK